jgi:hypothetical protein
MNGSHENLTSHGPLLNMPKFGLSGGEIMSVIDEGGDTVTIFTEDADDPERLNPTVLYRQDYLDLLQHAPHVSEEINDLSPGG